MSLGSWKAEFYPLDAKACERKDALAHSLRKWEGLSRKNLKKHGVVRTWMVDQRLVVCGDSGELLPIDSSSCALCQHFIVKESSCKGCPVYEAGHGCETFSSHVPWQWWDDTGDPWPMIRLLRKLVKLESGAK